MARIHCFGNRGHALGESFAKQLHSSLSSIFVDFGEERVTESSHLEKLCLIQPRVGRDGISDLTTNLIKSFLLEYTQTFADRYMHSRDVRRFTVERADFDFSRGQWRSRSYKLPSFMSKFVLLTPRDILTKDDTWINRSDMLTNYDTLPSALSNGELRSRVNFHFKNEMKKGKTLKHRRAAAQSTLQNYPIMIDYYIRQREKRHSEAKAVSEANVDDVGKALIENTKHFIEGVAAHTGFDHSGKHQSTADSIKYLRAVAEFVRSGGREFLKTESRRVTTEPELKLFFSLVWLGLVPKGTTNSLLRNGRLATASDLPIEIRTASNRNIEESIVKFSKYTQTQSLLLVFAFNIDDWQRVRNLQRRHDVFDRPEIVVIDATEPRGKR